MNKIVRNRSATPYSIKRSRLHVQTCIVATTLHGACTVELTDISHLE
jgi:hypothetical protein